MTIFYKEINDFLFIHANIISMNTNNPKEDDNIRVYIIVNKDLKMRAGKIASQVGHAIEQIVRFMEYQLSRNYKEWMNTSHAKIILKGSEKELTDIYDKYSKKYYITKIYDAGKTQVQSGSFTAIGIEPLQKLNNDIKELDSLKLL